ncbi:hypothetical protein [Kibdelosporangium banguiense]|uniref:hypothetical protein n=1 Tax=Kibdelosporangium banguiense TaxID=1365924 RepID=UPI003557EDF9
MSGATGCAAMIPAAINEVSASPGPMPYELALLDPTQPTIPEGYGKPVQGLLLNFEVEDVDAEWARLVDGEGLPVALSLRSEDFGRRHFIVADPKGVLIDVITPIAPSAQYADQFLNA